MSSEKTSQRSIWLPACHQRLCTLLSLQAFCVPNHSAIFLSVYYVFGSFSFFFSLSIECPRFMIEHTITTTITSIVGTSAISATSASTGFRFYQRSIQRQTHCFLIRQTKQTKQTKQTMHMVFGASFAHMISISSSSSPSSVAVSLRISSNRNISSSIVDLSFL